MVTTCCQRARQCLQEQLSLVVQTDHDGYLWELLAKEAQRTILRPERRSCSDRAKQVSSAVSPLSTRSDRGELTPLRDTVRLVNHEPVEFALLVDGQQRLGERWPAQCFRGSVDEA